MALINQQGIAHIVIVLGVIAVSVIGLAGWRIYDINKDGKVLLSSSESQAESQIDKLPLDISGIKSIEEISAIAIQQNSGSQIAIIELEQEDSGLVYKVRLKDGRVLVYNAANGQLVSSESEDPSNRESIPSGFVATINISRAKEIAQTVYPDKTVKKIEFELEDGVVVYSVRFTDGSRVDVSAVNGEIIRKEAEKESDSNQSTNSTEDSNSDENQNSSSSNDDNEQESVNDSNDQDDNSGSNSGSGGSGSDDTAGDSADEPDAPDDSDNR